MLAVSRILERKLACCLSMGERCAMLLLGITSAVLLMGTKLAVLVLEIESAMLLMGGKLAVLLLGIKLPQSSQKLTVGKLRKVHLLHSILYVLHV